MRIGVFGGSFDPVHWGHLLLAERCRESCGLDWVWFVPASTAPHKLAAHATPGDVRAQLLDLATGDHPAFAVKAIELERGGVSYTVDTIEQFQSEEASAEFFLLLGADSLEDLPNWREPGRVCELATPVVVGRPGSSPPNYDVLRGLVDQERIEHFRKHHVAMPLIDISSTEIRQRAAAGRSLRYLTHPAVVEAIESQGLYC
jgi:nicotinate-nucleotide adenylyltransferase